jgi:predicted TIM-barrel enzyme
MDAYIRAAIVLDKLDARSGSVKGLAAAHAKNGDTKRLIALVSETLKCQFRDSFFSMLNLQIRSNLGTLWGQAGLHTFHSV